MYFEHTPRTRRIVYFPVCGCCGEEITDISCHKIDGAYYHDYCIESKSVTEWKCPCCGFDTEGKWEILVYTINDEDFYCEECFDDKTWVETPNFEYEEDY